MKVRYRSGLDADWRFGEFSEVENLLKNNKDSFVIRLPCNHDETYNDEGIEYCKVCGDYLQVTSYRD